MNSTTRETLGPYRIVGPLGGGGMGEVYVARDASLGRSVAIKVLPQRFSGDRESLSRFTREARSASALNHPNIVTIHEVGSEGGTPYIVMEHIEGTDLRTMLRGGPLPNRRTLNIGAQIADGLAAAHEKGIVHRDLSTRNTARCSFNDHDSFASTIAADQAPRPPLVTRGPLMAAALVTAVLLVGAAGIAVLYNRTFPAAEAPAPSKKYIAVTQF